MSKKVLAVFIVTLVMISFTGCGNNNETSKSVSGDVRGGTEVKSSVSENAAPGKLEVRFGTESKTFTVTLYDNDTAAEIVRNLDKDGMNLPIYHFDDFKYYEEMQYYDIPSRFKIPATAESVKSEKAGELYYSAPNRIVLFYQDAEITGEFTKVGYMEDIDGLKDAVNKNTVVPGWGNKVISVKYSK